MDDVLKRLVGQDAIDAGEFWSQVLGLVFLINNDEALVENDPEKGKLFLFGVIRVGHIKIHKHSEYNKHTGGVIN